jgi:hypothetical protein
MNDIDAVVQAAVADETWPVSRAEESLKSAPSGP